MPPPRTPVSRPMPDLNRVACTSYAAGHGLHWIQSLHSINKQEVSRQTWRGLLLSVWGEVIIVRKRDGEIVWFRHHEPERLLALSRGPGTVVDVNDQYPILRVGSYGFSVQPDRGMALQPCPTDALPEDPTEAQLADRLEIHGGFSIRLHRSASARPEAGDGRGGRHRPATIAPPAEGRS